MRYLIEYTTYASDAPITEYRVYEMKWFFKKLLGTFETRLEAVSEIKRRAKPDHHTERYDAHGGRDWVY